MTTQLPKLPKIVGSIETVKFPDLYEGDIKAKIDTGAYSGALHCTKVREEVTTSGKVLRFSPFDQPDKEIRVDSFRIGLVRSSNGEAVHRYFIDTQILIAGHLYPITLSLADRSDMKWPVLIGRKFLRNNNFIVDVRQKTK